MVVDLLLHVTVTCGKEAISVLSLPRELDKDAKSRSKSSSGVGKSAFRNAREASLGVMFNHFPELAIE